MNEYSTNFKRNKDFFVSDRHSNSLTILDAYTTETVNVITMKQQ